jgi:hypothetical protein
METIPPGHSIKTKMMIIIMKTMRKNKTSKLHNSNYDEMKYFNKV